VSSVTEFKRFLGDGALPSCHIGSMGQTKPVASNDLSRPMRANLPIGNTSLTPPKGDWFGRLAVVTARQTGRPATFLLAVAVVIGWAYDGPGVRLQRHLATCHQPGMTIATFLMVFLIPATQNRDTAALQLKLDELILATKNAGNHIAGIEEESDGLIERAKNDVRRRAS
jgi:low affinity Fe/Cu permease